MKKICGLILLVLPLITITSYSQSEEQVFEGYQWYDNFIQFTYGEEVAENTFSYVLPATDTIAERTDILFERYEADGWYASGGVISVGLISTLPTDYHDLDLMDVLKTDNLDTRLSQGYDPWIPNTTYAPLQDITQGQYISSDAITGVRFTVHEERLGDIYIFEGITIDEKYLVSLMMPLFKVQNTDNPTAVLDDVVRSIIISTPEASFLTQDTNGTIDYDGVQFIYDPTLAYRIQVDTTPAVTGEAADLDMFGESPSWQTFIFVNPTRTRSDFRYATIKILPIDEFPDVGTPYGDTLVQLQEILQDRPDMNTYDERMVAIPIDTSSQVIIVQAEYLEFQGGAGIRYITQFSQEAYPISDSDLEYIFIGLSNDGKHVISVRFPLYVESLPTFEEAIPIDYGTFAEHYNSYMDETRAELNQLPPDGFLPSIDMSDTIITSIQVNR